MTTGDLATPTAPPAAGGALSGETADGLRAALPLLPVALALGTTFGVASRAAGLEPFAAILMSAVAYAGSAQFAAVAVVAAGGAPLIALVAGVMANARYIPMGVAIGRYARGGVGRRLVESQLIVDESWAIGFGGRSFSWPRMVGAGATFWIGWVSGTAFGALGGAAIGDLARFGFDGALAALFLVLALNQIASRRALLAAAGGVGVTLVTLPVLPVGAPIALATLVCLVGLRR